MQDPAPLQQRIQAWCDSPAFPETFKGFKQSRFRHIFESQKLNPDLISFQKSLLARVEENIPAHLDDFYRRLYQTLLSEHVLEEKIDQPDMFAFILTLGLLVPITPICMTLIAPALLSLMSLVASTTVTCLLACAAIAVLVTAIIFAMKLVFRLREPRLTSNAIYSQEENLEKNATLADPIMKKLPCIPLKKREGQNAFFFRLTHDKGNPEHVKKLQKMNLDAAANLGGPTGYQSFGFGDKAKLNKISQKPPISQVFR